jgi:phosphoglucomutase
MKGSFNEPHVVAIAKSVVEYRSFKGYKGPLFLGYDTHALSEAAWRTVLSVLAAYEVEVILSKNREYCPTPVISFMILEHNQRYPQNLADGLIITPSHNPPQDGGIKYNPPHGGPADLDTTEWIERRAKSLMDKPEPIKRLSLSNSLSAKTIKEADLITPFVEALGQIVDMKLIKSARLRLGVDPLGGSGVHFWAPIAERWGLNITVLNPHVDTSFSFMTLDADGSIRMDCSSPYAMANLLKKADKFDLCFGNDPDFDRHGIVSGGALMEPNHYLATAIYYLLQNRPNWPKNAKVGKTLVSSSIIDRVVKGAGRAIYETPVGFKWFVSGLKDSNLVFGGEESAGASFLRQDGKVWTTDKCGFCMTLLAAERAAKTEKLPHEVFNEITKTYGATRYRRIDSELATSEKDKLQNIDPDSIIGKRVGTLSVIEAFNRASGNNASIGGLKAILSDGSWFAMRPSGTEPKMKFYIETTGDQSKLEAISQEAPSLVFRR